MSFSNALAASVLDHIFGIAPYTAPATIYVALSTADPGEDGAGLAEPEGNGYARVATTAADWERTSQEVANVDEIAFPAATGVWGTITHFALINAATGGMVMSSAAVATSKSPTNGDVPKFGAGQLTTTLD